MPSFQDFLDTVRRGELILELEEKMAELVEAVTQHDGKGSLTLTLHVAPASDEMGTIKLLDDVKVKLPVAGRKSTTWFVNENYTLSRSDPAQLRLAVSPGDRIAGEVDPDAGSGDADTSDESAPA